MKYKKQYIIPIFIPHLGCNNECIFCNQRKISGSQQPVEKQQVKEIIDKYLDYFDNKFEKQIEIAFFGGSFTGIEIEKQIEYLEVVQPYINNRKIESIRISTRPDYINKSNLELLKKYKVKTIELGVQSLDDEILKIAKRGHTVKDVEVASKLIKDYGFVLGHQIMVGLPGSDFAKEKNTAEKSIVMRPEIVRIYPVLVIAKTELEEMFNRNEYTPLTLEEAINSATTLYSLYKENNIKVIRTGLHITEELAEESNFIAGPMHPAFGQMIQARIVRNKIDFEIQQIINSESKKIIIEAPQLMINYIVGVKRENIKYFNNKYNIDIYVNINKDLEKDTFKCKVI
ncbi:MAG: radical SAM protein [Clostridia bacterium]